MTDENDPLIEPTADERRNGWTAETLTDYVQQRERAQKGIVLFDPDYRAVKRPGRANSRYNPLRPWR